MDYFDPNKIDEYLEKVDNYKPDYNTNSESYYKALARHKYFMKLFTAKIITLQNELQKEFDEVKGFTKEKIDEFQKRLDDIKEEMKDFFTEWLDDGTIENFVQDYLYNNVLNNSLSINVKFLPPDMVSAKGDGITDDSEAVQNAIDLLTERYMGAVERESGYIAYAYPEIVFPAGIYLVNDVVLPKWVTLVGNGKAVIRSVAGDPTDFSKNGKFTDSIVTHLKVKNLKFVFYDTAFRIQTNNADQSFISFEDVSFSKMNLFIDTVSYTASRSTTFSMLRCNGSYDVRQIGRIYTDKSTFRDNWFNHSSSGALFYLDTLAVFESNMWIPTIPAPDKVWIEFDATDHARSLTFISERFSGEGGACSVVLVKNVNKNNSNNAYRNQGITFRDCQINIINQYNPENIAGAGVRHAVILDPTVDKNRSLGFVSFENCLFSPDLSGGMVGYYNRPDILNFILDTFNINFDYASAISATNGANKLVPDLLIPYTKIPENFQRELLNVLSNGKAKVVNTDITGRKKFTLRFKAVTLNPLKPHVFMLSLVGQGDSRYPSNAFVSTAQYILEVNGENDVAGTYLKINYTKLHSSVSGGENGANPTIVNVKFVESNTNRLNVSGAMDRYIDIEVEFGTNISTGHAYAKPMFDFSLIG